MNYNYPIFNPMYQNPTPSQMFQPQQFQPQVQMPQTQQSIGIPGKVVEGFDNVRTMDIPMDGNMYYFPKADGSEIYTKRWLQNGTTEQLTYKVQQVETEPEKPNPIFEKLDGIQEQINKLEELISKQQPKATNKKEG